MWSAPLLLTTGAVLVAAADPAPPLKCGVASTVFTTNTGTVDTALANGLDFWWNWDVHQKIDTSDVAPENVAKMKDRFVPMFWGQALEPDFAFMQDHEGDVMGTASLRLTRAQFLLLILKSRSRI